MPVGSTSFSPVDFLNAELVPFFSKFLGSREREKDILVSEDDSDAVLNSYEDYVPAIPMIDDTVSTLLSLALALREPKGVSESVSSPVVARSQPVTSSVPPKQSPSKNLLVTGDSVATGIGHGGKRGTSESDAQWGRSSAQQLAYMLRKGPQYYSNRDVILSSGALNSGDLSSVDKQLKFLVDSGARSVRLAGAPVRGQFSRLNAPLQSLAAKYGVTFMGPYESSDNIHPKDYSRYR